jgi:ligand-binding sensor domain-containing protein/CheY-like chemotaxis protein
MMCKWILLLALACQGTAHSAVPEMPRFRLLGVAEGMPSSSVNALARDRDGYLWIATVDGLARYDGVGFRVWRHVPGDPRALPGNIVQALHIDTEDRIWVATEFGGLSVLDRTRNGFRHYRQVTHPQVGSDDAWTIASRDGDLWFGTGGGGLHRLDSDGRITRWTSEAGGLPSDTVLALVFDAAGVLWIGTDAGLARFDGVRITPVALPGDAGAPLIYSLTRDDNALWVGTATGVFQRRHDGRWVSPGWSPMFERPNALTSIVRDHDGALWIGSQRGLWRALPGATPTPVAAGGPGIAKAVQSLLLQEDGALWTPVAGAGVGFLRSDWRRVAQFARAEGLSAQLYPAIAPARSAGVWLGGADGTVERLDANGAITRLAAGERARLKDLRILAIAEDPAGRLWLGHRRGLLRIAGGVIDEWTADDAVDPVPAGQVDLLRIAPDGMLWLSAQGGGVQRRDPVSGKVLDRMVTGARAGGELGAGDTEALEFAPDGTAWVAGGTGLAQWDRLRGRFISVHAMGHARVHAFAFDGSNGLWLHRITGLERYQRNGVAWRRTATVTPGRGLPAVESAAMRVDRAHRVWLSTPRGLYRWDPRRHALRRFGVQHGLGSQEFVDRALALTAAGTIAATTANGAVVLVDTEAMDKHGSPQLRVDSFAVRRQGRWEDWPQRRAIELAPADHEFRVRPRLLAYDDPSANRYWTRLEGFDRDWVAQGPSGERVFTSLAPGKYILAARAIDAAGNPAREQQLHFRVLPPWWRTKWARAMAFALCVLLAWWGARAYRAHVHRQLALRSIQHGRVLAEQASEAKTRFLATLGHEVRTPMTGVLGMTELLLGTSLEARQRGYAESIRNAGQHLLRLVNDTLDLARIEADKMRLEDIPFDLRALLQEVCQMLAPLAQAKGLAFHCDVAEDLPRGLRGDAHRVRQILLNLGSNAIKFTERGEVVLRAVALSSLGVRLEVTDTGAGLDAAQQARLFQRFEQAEGARTAARYGGSGLGLAICRELAVAMGGTIGVDSRPGEGACFHVELPLPVAVISVARVDDAGERPTSRRILLVEDDPIAADAVLGLLQVQGHAVTHAQHGLAALSALQAKAHDLAFVDLDLPGIDGFALARLLREQGHALPLVALTARADAGAQLDARAAGMAVFLRKPVTGAMLAGAIEMALPQPRPRPGLA